MNKKPELRRLFPFALIFILGLAIYSHTFQSSFHLDDAGSIVDNEELHDFSNFDAVWEKHKSRIAAYWTLGLNYRFSKLNVAPYHIFNFLVHILSSYLVYFLALLILKTPRLKDSPLETQKEMLALFSSLIFLAHPLQTQAVTYIVQRIASLAALFYLACLAAYLKARMEGKVGFYLIAVVSAGLAMFTKENSYTIPLMLAAVELILFGSSIKSWRAILMRTLPFLLLLGVVYFSCYHEGFASVSLGEMTRAGSALSRKDYLLTQINVLRTYLRLLFVPFPQNLDYDYPVTRSLWNGPTLASLGLHLALVTSAFVFVKKRPLFSFGIFWFYLTLSVESSFIPIEDVIFEHRLYLPLFAFSILLPAEVFLIFRNRQANRVFLSTVIAIFSVLTFLRNNVWKDESTLWQDVLAKSPGKVRPYDNLGAHLLHKGRLKEAEDLLRQALSKNLASQETYNSLGVAVARQGRSQESIEYYEKALQMNPEFDKAHNNFGISLTNVGRVEEAVKHFNQALRLKPNYAEAHRNLGSALLAQGKKEEALFHFQLAVRFRPDYPEALTNLGILAYQERKLDEALRFFGQSIRVAPHYAEAYNNMGVALADLGKLEEAKAFFRKAAELRPDYEDPKNNLEKLG